MDIRKLGNPIVLKLAGETRQGNLNRVYFNPVGFNFIRIDQ
jgi:hypothetical protein